MPDNPEASGAFSPLILERCTVCGILAPQKVPGGKIVATPCAHKAGMRIQFVAYKLNPPAGRSES